MPAPAATSMLTPGYYTCSTVPRVESDTFGHGAAGNVTVQARTVLVDGQAADAVTIISSDALSTVQDGAAGKVTVKADTIDVLNGGKISSNTDGPGRGGDVSVSAHNLTLDGGAVRVSLGFLPNRSAPPMEAPLARCASKRTRFR